MIPFCLLITVLPFTRHPIWSHFIGELTVIKYVGAVCLAYALVALTTRRTPLRLFRTGQARCFALLTALAIVSFVVMGPSADTPRWETSSILSYVSFLFLFFITLVLVDSLDRLRWALLAAIAATGVASLYVLREWQKYDGSGVWRPGWVTGDANYFTVSAVLCLPLAFSLARERSRPRWQRVFCLSCLGLTLLATVLAASRGGFLGLIAVALVLVCHSAQRTRNLLLTCALVVPLTFLSPTSVLDRLLQPSGIDQGSAAIRLGLWKAGGQIALDHLLMGVGLGYFKPMMRSYSDDPELQRGAAHNSYVEIAAELGFPALITFLALLFLTFRSLDRVRRLTLRSSSALPHQAALGIQAGLAGAAVAILFVSGHYQRLFWLMIFLSICLTTLVHADAPARRVRRTAHVAPARSGVENARKTHDLTKTARTDWAKE